MENEKSRKHEKRGSSKSMHNEKYEIYAGHVFGNGVSTCKHEVKNAYFSIIVSVRPLKIKILVVETK